MKKFIAIPFLLMVLSGVLPITGGYLNITVMQANGGKMPVTTSVPAKMDDRHCPLTKDSKYPLLADVFVHDHSILSVGDILIFSNKFLLILCGIYLICIFTWSILSKWKQL